MCHVRVGKRCGEHILCVSFLNQFAGCDFNPGGQDRVADSLNVVLIGTRSKEKLTASVALQKGTNLVRRGVVRMPTFPARLLSFRADPPPSFLRSPELSDDFAPVDGLLRGLNW